MRRNRPADGYWFVPGGRIRKGETLDRAFDRISRSELGLAITPASASFAGVWEHFYPDNAGSMPDFGTHYVVLAYRIQLDPIDLVLPMSEQHDSYRWVRPDLAADDMSVHRYSRDYFTD